MKNIKFTKKLLSMLTAGVLMGAPVIANGDTDTNNSGFKLVKQEMKVPGNDLNLNNYINRLESSYNYLKHFLYYSYHPFP